MIILNSGKPLTAVEEAKVYDRLSTLGWKQKDIAKKFGKSKAHVSNIMKLLNMSDELRKALNADLIKTSVAIQVVKENPEVNKQETVLKSANEKRKLLGKKRISENHVKPEKKRSRYHRLFTDSISLMKKDTGTYTKDQVEKVKFIMEALDSKSPEDLIELLTSII